MADKHDIIHCVHCKVFLINACLQAASGSRPRSKSRTRTDKDTVEFGHQGSRPEIKQPVTPKIFKNPLVRINWELLFFVALTIGVNLPLFSRLYVPEEDTYYGYQQFFAQYSELLFHHHWAYWFPYVVYGQPSFMLFQLGPAGYLACLVGIAFKWTNALAVYKAAVVLTEVVFVTGTYLCSRLIYKESTSVWIVCASASLCTVWFIQSGFNLIDYYLLPWVAYFILRYFRYGELSHLWMAAICILLWTVSGPTYFVGLYVFSAFVLFAVLAIARPRVISKSRFTTRNSLLTGAALVCLTILLALFVMHMPDNMELRSIGRSAGSGTVNLDHFLTTGPLLNMSTLTETFLSGNMPYVQYGGYDRDCTVYFGFIPGLLALVSVLWIRRPAHLMFFVLMMTILELSAGGILAHLIYFFPLMNYFRYIGLTLGIAKVAGIFCAGFTIDELLTSSLERMRAVTRISICLVITAALMHAAAIYWAIDDWEQLGIARIAAYVLSIILAIGSLSYIYKQIVFGKRLVGTRAKSIIGALLTVSVMIDLATFQMVEYSQLPTYPASKAAVLTVLNARPLNYHPERTDIASTDLQQKAYSVLDPQTSYAMEAEFCDSDLVHIKLRIDFKTKPVDQLFQSCTIQGARFAALVGGTVPKLRLLEGAVLSPSASTAHQLLNNDPDPGTIGIIEATACGMPAGAQYQSDPATQAGSAEELSFDANDLTAAVSVVRSPGAWLIYDDSYCPGWHASDNGRSTKIFLADTAFKAIWLSTGHHTVKFWFRSRPQCNLADIVSGIETAVGISFALVVAVLCTVPRRVGYVPIDTDMPSELYRTLATVKSFLAAKRPTVIELLDFKRRENRNAAITVSLAGVLICGTFAGESALNWLKPGDTVSPFPICARFKVLPIPGRGSLFSSGLELSMPTREVKKVKRLEAVVDTTLFDVPIADAIVVSVTPTTTFFRLPTYVSTPKSSYAPFQSYIDWPGDQAVKYCALAILFALLAGAPVGIGIATLTRWVLINYGADYLD